MKVAHMLVIEEKDDYSLCRYDDTNGYSSPYYWVYKDVNGDHSRLIDFWRDPDHKWNPEDIEKQEFIDGMCHKKFLKAVDGDKNKKPKDNSKKPSYSKGIDTKNPASSNSSWLGYNGGYSYKPAPRVPKNLDDYCKSNTLCLHKSDPTTTMLSQIYDGKGWDVINNSYDFTSNEIATLIDRHERIVMLGHGSSGGLIGFIGPEHAKHLEPKKIFALWCNADGYCNHYLPNKKGFFACGNMPSDDNEARWVGYHVTHEYMDENITYWCKLCGDVVEQCLEDDADAGCKYIRDKYWEKYGTSEDPDEIGITVYNYQRTKVAGQDLIPAPIKDVPQPHSSYSSYSSYSGYSSGDKYQRISNSDKADLWGSTWTPSTYRPRVAKPGEERLIDAKVGDDVFTTTNGYECKITEVETDNRSYRCALYDKDGKVISTRQFVYINKSGSNVFDAFNANIDLGKLVNGDGEIVEDMNTDIVNDVAIDDESDENLPPLHPCLYPLNESKSFTLEEDLNISDRRLLTDLDLFLSDEGIEADCVSFEQRIKGTYDVSLQTLVEESELRNVLLAFAKKNDLELKSIDFENTSSTYDIVFLVK